MVSFILGSFYDVDVYLSVNYFDQFGFNSLFDAIKRRRKVMTDSWALLMFELGGSMGVNLMLHWLITTAQTEAPNNATSKTAVLVSRIFCL